MEVPIEIKEELQKIIINRAANRGLFKNKPQIRLFKIIKPKQKGIILTYDKVTCELIDNYMCRQTKTRIINIYTAVFDGQNLELTKGK